MQLLFVYAHICNFFIGSAHVASRCKETKLQKSVREAAAEVELKKKEEMKKEEDVRSNTPSHAVLDSSRSSEVKLEGGQGIKRDISDNWRTIASSYFARQHVVHVNQTTNRAPKNEIVDSKEKAVQCLRRVRRRRTRLAVSMREDPKIKKRMQKNRRSTCIDELP